jgi:lysylphosphatidylglycerol synthetase-like protein (DUF2156 family)
MVNIKTIYNNSKRIIKLFKFSIELNSDKSSVINPVLVYKIDSPNLIEELYINIINLKIKDLNDDITFIVKCYDIEEKEFHCECIIIKLIDWFKNEKYDIVTANMCPLALIFIDEITLIQHHNL